MLSITAFFQYLGGLNTSDKMDLYIVYFPRRGKLNALYKM